MIRIGVLDFEEAWRLQQELWRSRREKKTDDILLLLQHPPTVTLGRRGNEKNLLIDKAELQRKGIGFFLTDRGGDITYHGPGQLIGYPVVSLKDNGLSGGVFMKLLEEVIILTLKELEIEATRMLRRIGLWVNGKKIASLGTRIRSGITTHGFALNINNDLRPFQHINPCGIKGLKVTSLMEILGKKADYGFIEERISINFSRVFRMIITEVSNL